MVPQITRCSTKLSKLGHTFLRECMVPMFLVGPMTPLSACLVRMRAGPRRTEHSAGTLFDGEALTAGTGRAAETSAGNNFFNSKRYGVLASWNCVTRLVKACSTRGGCFCCVISFVFGWSWILRFSQLHSRTSTKVRLPEVPSRAKSCVKIVPWITGVLFFEPCAAPCVELEL